MSNGKWLDEFLKRGPAGSSPAGATPVPEDAGVVSAREEAQDEFDELPGIDPTNYKAFITQRGRSRPSMFLDLRTFDARSGVLQGTMLSYPTLTVILLSVQKFSHLLKASFPVRRAAGVATWRAKRATTFPVPTPPDHHANAGVSHP